jgi:hypothetical protein
MINIALLDIQLKAEEEDLLPENACKKIVQEYVSENYGRTLIADNNFYFFRAEIIQDYIKKLDQHNTYRSKADITKILKRIGVDTDRRRLKGVQGPVALYKIPKSYVNIQN